MEVVWNDSANNVQTATAWTPNRVPTSGDTWRFPRGARVPPSAGLNNAAVMLARLLTDDGCAIDIGGQGMPLIIGIDKTIHRGGGTIYPQFANADTDIVINSPNLSRAMYISTGTIDLARVLVGRGRFVFANPTATIITAEVSFLETVRNDAIFEVTATDAAISFLNQLGGQSFVGSAITQASFDGGEHTQVSGAVGFLRVNGGRVWWDSGSGIDTYGWISRGTFDSTRIRRERTMGDITVGPYGVYNFYPEITSHISLRYHREELGYSRLR